METVMNRMRRKFRQSLMPSTYVTYNGPVSAPAREPVTASSCHSIRDSPSTTAPPVVLPKLSDDQKDRLDIWLSHNTVSKKPHVNKKPPIPPQFKPATKWQSANNLPPTPANKPCRADVHSPQEYDACRTRPVTAHHSKFDGQFELASNYYRKDSGSCGLSASSSGAAISGSGSGSDMSYSASGQNMQPHLTHSLSNSNSMNSHQSTSTGMQQAAPLPNGISRKKIISKSQEAGLNDEELINEEEDDVWYDKEALFRHHIREVLEKWSSIDDEIWGKIICMEKNRRVAKAYARVPVLTINGSEDGFDGYHIGLSGFDNPKRHPETQEVKKHIGQGIKLKLDNDGNILVKRISSSPVYVRNTVANFQEDHCFSNEVIKIQGQLDLDRPVKVFDMKRFTTNIHKEMKGGYPNKQKLELQCFTNIAFVQQDADHLETPCWIMLINIVALDMLNNKLPMQMQVTPSGRGLTGTRSAAMIENVSAKRFLSTPRDDHYPRLMHMQHSMPDMQHLAEANEYADDFDDRASISTYNFNPGYRAPSAMLPAEYADVIHHHRRQPLQDAMYRSLEQQQMFQDAYYSDMAAGYSAAGSTGYRTPLGHHSGTEPNFKLRDSGTGTGTSKHFTTPSLARFAPQHRHSRSYDSGLESDMTSSSDETDYSRWTSYSRLHMLPRQQQQQQQSNQRLPEWE